MWEPLLEPLEDEAKDGFRPWTLELKVTKANKYLKNSNNNKLLMLIQT